MFDAESASGTMPYMEIREVTVGVTHEATVGEIGDGDIFPLRNRGLDVEDAK